MASNSDQINSEHKTSFWLINTNKPIDLECKLFITKENQASTLKDESWKFGSPWYSTFRICCFKRKSVSETAICDSQIEQGILGKS